MLKKQQKWTDKTVESLCTSLYDDGDDDDCRSAS